MTVGSRPIPAGWLQQRSVGPLWPGRRVAIWLAPVCLIIQVADLSGLAATQACNCHVLIKPRNQAVADQRAATTCTPSNATTDFTILDWWCSMNEQLGMEQLCTQWQQCLLLFSPRPSYVTLTGHYTSTIWPATSVAYAKVAYGLTQRGRLNHATYRQYVKHFQQGHSCLHACVFKPPRLFQYIGLLASSNMLQNELCPRSMSCLLTIVLILYVHIGLTFCFTWGYHGGSPTAAQAWRPYPLWVWEPSL